MSIVKRGNQVEAQREAFSFVSVRAAQNMEAFEPSQNVFHDQTLLGQKSVLSSLLGCERMMLAFFVGCARVLMVLLESFVATVSQTNRGGQERQTGVFE